jgi:hypothetical protein
VFVNSFVSILGLFAGETLVALILLRNRGRQRHAPLAPFASAISEVVPFSAGATPEQRFF